MSSLHYEVVGDFLDRRRHRAPLQHVAVTGTLRDTVAQYTLQQTYLNPREDAAIRAAYTFPLYEGVAVSGFEAEVDGRRIVGKVLEKAAAKEEYEKAVQKGKVASLLEQESPDVFQASVGNVPPASTVLIRVTLISVIKQDADENQIRFVLPTSIAPRYGYGPEVYNSMTTSTFSVDIACAMTNQITSVQSPSHTIHVHLGSVPMMVSLTSEALLDRDFILIVQAVDLDAPRAFIELHPRDRTHAVSLTFSPRFSLNALKSTELIFVVDRSGSMQTGSQVKQAREALELFLRSIPAEDHYINIIGFGSTHESLFSKSVEYSAESLKTTTMYARSLGADMGGTELLSAFQEVFRSRRRDVPTQVFLLTDGQVWSVDELVQCIKEGVEEGEKQGSFVRVFPLGIGVDVSHHLIESVARAGNGYAQLVVAGERMEKKVVNMLKSALRRPVTNVGIQWTDGLSSEDDFEMVEAAEEDVAQSVVADPPQNVINLYSTVPSPPSPPPPPPAPLVLPIIVTPILQAPFKLPALYPGARFTIYAILSSEAPVPKEIVLRGASPDGPVELKVNMESVQEGETMLHALAARSLVRDLEEGASYIHALEGHTTATNEHMLKNLRVHVVKGGKKCHRPSLTTTVVSKFAKQQILELALKYNLSSKYTSWVAIDTESDRRVGHDEIDPGSVRMNYRCLMQMPSPSACSPGQLGRPCRPSRKSVRRKGLDVGRNDLFGVASPAYVSSFAPLRQCQVTLESFPPVPPVPSIGFMSDELKEEEEGYAKRLDPHARLHLLLRHQQFDGLFPLVPRLATLLSTTVEKLKAKLAEFQKDHGLQLSETEWEALWATCVAAQFLRKELPGLQDEWELVVEKAEKRVAAMVKSAEDAAAMRLAACEVVITDHVA